MVCGASLVINSDSCGHQQWKNNRAPLLSKMLSKNTKLAILLDLNIAALNLF